MKTACLLALLLIGCQVGEPARPTKPELDLAASTYKILTPSWAQGTAWVAAPDGYLITAGHVCDEGPGEYMLLQGSIVLGLARPVVWTLDDEADEPVDVCLLKSDAVLGPPLPIADKMPEPGDAMEYVGYPMGHLFHSFGEYVGDADGPEQKWNNYFSTAPCDHGASGSAMKYEEGVYGVLVRVYFDGDVRSGAEGCVASPLNQIQEVLATIK